MTPLKFKTRVMQPRRSK